MATTGRKTLPERTRKAIQNYVVDLVARTRGGQTALAEVFGVSQTAVWKAEKKMAAGRDILDAVLGHSGLEHDAFVEKYGPPASTIVAVVVAENPGRWQPATVAEYHRHYGSDESKDIAQRLDEIALVGRLRKDTGRAASGGSQSAHDGPGGRRSPGSGAAKKGARRAG